MSVPEIGRREGTGIGIEEEQQKEREESMNAAVEVQDADENEGVSCSFVCIVSNVNLLIDTRV